MAEKIEVIVEDGEAMETIPEVEAEPEQISSEGIPSEGLSPDEYVHQLQRLQADFDNYRKRIRREREQLDDQIRGDFSKQLLPILDDLKRAMAHSESDQNVLREGIELVHKNLKSILETSGLSTVPSEGAPFDPHLHEAVMVEEDPTVQGELVAAVLETGYMFKGRLLRPAKVKVHKGPEHIIEAETAVRHHEKA